MARGSESWSRQYTRAIVRSDRGIIAYLARLANGYVALQQKKFADRPLKGLAKGPYRMPVVFVEGLAPGGTA